MTTPDRKLICLRLVEQANGLKLRAAERCTSERLPGSDLCARHLGDAAADFRMIIGSALWLAGVTGDGDRE